MHKMDLEKFGYPELLINDYKYWYLLLRKEQVTLGSMILICKETVSQYSRISNSCHNEMISVIRDIETKIVDHLKFEKINYLMYMMVDDVVHFHVIPRYSSNKSFRHVVYIDEGWPGTPILSSYASLDLSDLYLLRDKLRAQLNN
jgi:diadenosine tetraphosphate (Ap4A) HIT family hydrolase